MQLLLELLATLGAGEPIPVLVSLAGWDPTTHPRLHGWLAERLVEDYPSLRAFGPDVARALAEQGHILPILDGLDELPPARQPDVITALNASLTETDQLMLTSRTREYDIAIAEAHRVLTAAAVIEPEPLTPLKRPITWRHASLQIPAPHGATYSISSTPEQRSTSRQWRPPHWVCGCCAPSTWLPTPILVPC